MPDLHNNVTIRIWVRDGDKRKEKFKTKSIVSSDWLKIKRKYKFCTAKFI